MFGKLIKHEFKAISRIMLPVIVMLLLVSVFANVALRVMDNANSSNAANFISAMVVGVWITAILALFTAVFVLIIIHFYRSVIGPEGYLTLTLPATTEEVILSKLIAAVLWIAITAVVFCAAIGLGLVRWAILKDIASSDYSVILAWLKENVGIGNIILLGLELLLLAAIGTADKILHFYLAMAVGQTSDKHKTLRSIIAYIGLGTVFMIVGVRLLPIAGEFIDCLEKLMQTTASQGPDMGMVHAIMLSACLASAVGGAILFLPTDLLLKRKLNI